MNIIRIELYQSTEDQKWYAKLHTDQGYSYFFSCGKYKWTVKEVKRFMKAVKKKKYFDTYLKYEEKNDG